MAFDSENRDFVPFSLFPRLNFFKEKKRRFFFENARDLAFAFKHAECDRIRINASAVESNVQLEALRFRAMYFYLNLLHLYPRLPPSPPLPSHVVSRTAVPRVLYTE